MIPIYEQGSGRGIGHGLESFLRRFDAICAEHLAHGRAKAFAFILYDFTDRAVREILEDQGVFAQLDRLAGTELSVFYLHADSRAAFQSFNEHFFRTLELEGQATLPCVVFFRVHERQIQNLEIAQLESADLIHGFGELYGAIENYLRENKAAPTESSSRAIRWLKGGGKFVSIEVFRVALKRALEFWT